MGSCSKKTSCACSNGSDDGIADVRSRGFRPISVFGALLIAALVTVTSTASPASSQTIGSIELIAQSAWVDGGGIFSTQVRVAGADAESVVRLEVYPPWEERGAFLRRELTSNEPLFEIEPIPLSDLQDTSNEVLSIEFEVRASSRIPGSNESETDGLLPILRTAGEPGVYPVEILLTDPEGLIIDRLQTSLIQLPRNDRPSPLRTAIVIEANPDATVDSDGNSILTPEDLADLGVLVDAATQHPEASVALSITADTLLALDRSEDPAAANLLDRIATLTSSQLIASPFAELEEQAWIDAGLTDQLHELYQAGADATTELVGVTPESRVLLLDRTITSEGLESFARRGVEGVIVRPAQVETLDREVFPQALTTRFLIPADDAEPVPALVADGALANHFISEQDPIARANRLLADLSLLSFQNADVRQAAVVNPPADWVVDATFLNVVLSGIERIPVLQGAAPFEALANAAFTPAAGVDTISAPLQRELTPRRRPVDLRSYRTEFSQASAAIESWTTVIASDQRSTDRLNELLHLSTARDLSDAQRQGFIDQVYIAIDNQKDDSITTPASETVTLTGRRSELPILIDNNLDIDAAVVVILDSEKLDFPEGRELTVVLEPGPTRVEIPIEARASGDSPIRLQIFSPDRSILLGSSEVLVRTFAFSGVGVIIGAIALGVLLLWWLRNKRSRRDTVVEVQPIEQNEQLVEDRIGAT